MDAEDTDDVYALNDPVNGANEDRRRDFEASVECNINWETFLLEGVVDRSSDDSDYQPSEIPLSDDTSDIIVDKGKHVIVDSEKDSDEEELADQGVDAPEIDSSDEELKTARQRVQKYREQLEKEKEAQLSEYEDSDGDVQILSDNEDDDNAKMRRRRRSKMTVGGKIDYKNFVWEVGMRFPNMAMFKEHTRSYGIYNGFNLSFVLSDKQRMKVGVMCKEGCPFRVYASWHHKEGCFMVKSVTNEHACVRDMQKNRQLTSKWLAQQYLSRFKHNLNWPAEEMMDSVRSRYGVIIQRWNAYKAKTAALKMLHGSVKQHYNKIGRFIEELKRSNMGSTFELLTIPSSPPVFQRFYVCFKSLRCGQLEGCRPFICLDGCHLKTFLGGILLAAVGRDGNNQMFPICWAVVEGETRDTWEWFLNKLKSELNGSNGEGWTFMSDQQKGLLAASASVFPSAYHRNCARHIYANWHKMHKGDELKMYFWRAVRAYNETDFEEAVEELKKTSSKAAEDFLNQNPKVFCRAFFPGVSKCDVVVNNMAETFNGYILKAREKHIIDMLDTIRSMLMERMLTKKSLMDKQGDNAICPRIKLKLEEEKVKAWELSVIPSTVTVFQVREFVDVFKVDVQEHSCTCRKWDVTGIPCHHGVAALSFLKVAPENYVDNYYKKDNYLRAYQGNLSPCVSEKFWPKVNFPLEPPPIRILPGRPKKNRRKDPHEDPKKPGKLTKHGVLMTCSVCKSTEHNKRRCPNISNSSIPAEKRSRGRPRKHPRQNAQTLVGEVGGASGEANAGRGRGRGGGRVGRGRGGTRLATAGMGIIYDEGGSILYRSSVSGPVVELNPGYIGSSQVSHEVQPSAPVVDN